MPKVESALTGCARWHSIGPGQKRCCRQLSGGVLDSILAENVDPVSGTASCTLKSMCAFTPLIPKELVPAQQKLLSQAL